MVLSLGSTVLSLPEKLLATDEKDSDLDDQTEKALTQKK